jgi:uncharacterized protein (DUF2141 family)
MKWLQVSVMAACAIGSMIFAPSAEGIANGNLTVAVNGLKNQKGQVCLTVFSSSRGFPFSSDRAVAVQCVKPVGNRSTATFRNLKAGSYAVAVIHDINNDKVVNTNGIGIPTEGFGFSRNPRILTGPPKFGDSSVLVAGADTEIEVKLQYLLGG